MNFRYTLIIICIASNWLYAQDTTIYTLQKCIDIALQNNLTLAVSKNQTDGSKAYLQQARAGLLPTINGYANQGMSNGKSINPFTNTFINQEVNTGQYGVNGSLNLFSGLTNINTLLQTTHAYKAATFDVEQIKIDITLLVLNAYLQISSSEELLKQAQQQMEVTTAQVERLHNLDKNNAISPSVLYDTKGQLANDKLILITAKATLQTAKLTLAQILNTNFTTSTKFQKIETQQLQNPLANNESVINEGLKNSPTIKSSEYKTKSALKNLHTTYGQLFPSLSLNANLGSNYSSAAFSQKVIGVKDEATDAYISIGGNNESVIAPQNIFQSDKIKFNNQVTNNLNTYIGLSLQMPLFNGFKNRTQIKLAQLNYKQSKEQQKNTVTKFKNQLEQAINDLNNSLEKYNIIQQQVLDYTESFRIANTKFEKEALTILEYITAKTNSEKAKASLIMAYYDSVLKQKTINIYSKGSL